MGRLDVGMVIQRKKNVSSTRSVATPSALEADRRVLTARNATEPIAVADPVGADRKQSENGIRIISNKSEPSLKNALNTSR